MNWVGKAFIIAAVFASVALLVLPLGALAGTYYLDGKCKLPPAISSGTKPNVMVILDYSGSMQWPAYWNDTNSQYYVNDQYVNLIVGMNAYRPTETYYGVFDPNKNYKYDGSAANKEYFYEVDPVVTITSSATSDGGAAIVFTCNADPGLEVGDVAVFSGLNRHTTLNGNGYMVTWVSGNQFKITAPWNPPGLSDTEGTVRTRSTGTITASADGGSGTSILFTSQNNHFLAVNDVVYLTGLTSHRILNENAYYVASVPSGTTFTINPAPATWNGVGDSSGLFQKRVNGDFSSGISGNILNFYIATRMDAAQKALIGGRADCPGDGNCYLKAQGARRAAPESTILNAEFFIEPGNTLRSGTVTGYDNDEWSTGDYWNKTTYITVRDYQHYGEGTDRWTYSPTAAGFVSFGLAPLLDADGDNGCSIRVYQRKSNGTNGNEVNPDSVYNTTSFNTRSATGHAHWEKASLPTYQYGYNVVAQTEGNHKYYLYGNVQLTATGSCTQCSRTDSRIGNRANKKRMQVRLKVPEDQRQGVLQKNFNNLRIGLMTFQDTNSSLRGQIVLGCDNTDMVKMVKAVQADEAYVSGYDETTYARRIPRSGTPTAGSIYEALRYFKQETTQSGGSANQVNSDANLGFIQPRTSHDPYYDLDQSGTLQFMQCRKSFALLVTDGEPWDSAGLWAGQVYYHGNFPQNNHERDPSHASRLLHTTTLRTSSDCPSGDTNCYQNVPNAELYGIYTFGGTDDRSIMGKRCVRTTALFGAYRDFDETACTAQNDWPYPFTSFSEWDSRNVAYSGLTGNIGTTTPYTPVATNCPSTGAYDECCKEWDQVWDRFGVGGNPDKGQPDTFFDADDGVKLERGLGAALQSMAGALGGAGGAVAAVYRDNQGENQTKDYLGDLVLRGVYDANDPNANLYERKYLWRGHLEVFWPFREGAPETINILSSESASSGTYITFTVAGTADLLVGDKVKFTGLDKHTSLNFENSNTEYEVKAVSSNTFSIEAPWDPPAEADAAGQIEWTVAKYDFDLTEAFDTTTQQIKLCKDIALDTGTYGAVRHCWDAAQVLSQRVANTLDPRTIYMPKYEWDTATNIPKLSTPVELDTLPSAWGTDEMKKTWAYLLRGSSDISSTAMTALETLITWLKGYDNTDTLASCRDRRDSSDNSSWPLGDIVFSSPVVMGIPSPDAVSPNDESSPGGRTSYNTFYNTQANADPKPPQVIYVGANDGMIHAFILGRWSTEQQRYLNHSGEGCSDCGKEIWAFMPSTVMNQVQQLAELTYGTESGCKHRSMVDLSPKAHQVYINGEWKTVIVGGLRGGGDEYFALDVTDPNNPKLLWEYSVLKDLLTYDGAQYRKLLAATEHYEELKLLPVTWSKAALGRLNLGTIALPTEDPNSSGQPVTASPALAGDRHVVFVGGGFKVFDRTFEFTDGSPADGDLPTTLQKPFLLALDVATGKNLFRYVWPSIQHYLQSTYPDVYFRYITRNSNLYGIPYAMSDPLVLDYLRKMSNGSIASDTDGYVDHLFVGDLNGILYGFKFNLFGLTGENQGVRVDLRLTKGIDESSSSLAPFQSMYRSLGQPIVVQPQAKKEEYYPGYMRVVFGTGKYDDVLAGKDDRTDPIRMSLYNMRDVIGGTTIGTDGTPTYKPPKVNDTGAAGQEIGNSDFYVYVRNMCGTMTNTAGARSKSYDTGCTWLKDDGAGNLVRDCCEDSCANSCWQCVYDLKLPGPLESTEYADGTELRTTDTCEGLSATECAAKPGERINSDALVYRDWIFVTSYVPAATPCDYKGHGYLYAFGWMCNTVSDPFTDDNLPHPPVVGGYRMVLGEGMPSNPVLDSHGRFAFVQMSDRRIIKISVAPPSSSTPPYEPPVTEPENFKTEVMGWSEREK